MRVGHYSHYAFNELNSRWRLDRMVIPDGYLEIVTLGDGDSATGNGAFEIPTIKPKHTFLKLRYEISE